MKRWCSIAAALVLSGCLAHVTPRGVTLEPLLDFHLSGPPVVVAPGGRIAVGPLPPVVVVPDRGVYYYQSLYYYYYDDDWYYSRYRRGPWQSLPKEYYPSRMERRDSSEIRRRDSRGGRGGGELERR